MKKVMWCLFVAIFVLPSALYFVVNGYWWLFDGNIPIPDKMTASFLITLFGSSIAGMWADLGEVWR